MDDGQVSSDLVPATVEEFDAIVREIRDRESNAYKEIDAAFASIPVGYGIEPPSALYRRLHVEAAILRSFRHVAGASFEQVVEWGEFRSADEAVVEIMAQPYGHWCFKSEPALGEDGTVLGRRYFPRKPWTVVTIVLAELNEAVGKFHNSPPCWMASPFAEPPKSPKPGFVYVLRAENGLYKIGKALDLSARVLTLGTIGPVPVEFVCAFRASDYSALEREAHVAFAELRVRGEWFQLSEQLVADIKATADIQEL